MARLASPYINRHLSHSPLQPSFHNIHQKYQQPLCPLLTSSSIIDLPSSSSIGHHYHHHQQLPAIMHTSALQRARQLSITRKTTTASQHARLNSSPHTTACHLAHFGSSVTTQLSPRAKQQQRNASFAFDKQLQSSTSFSHLTHLGHRVSSSTSVNHFSSFTLNINHLSL